MVQSFTLLRGVCVCVWGLSQRSGSQRISQSNTAIYASLLYVCHVNSVKKK